MITLKNLFFKAVFLVIVLFAPAVLFAQNIPPGSNPGAEAERYRKAIQEQRKQLQERKAPPPPVEITKEEEKAPSAGALSFILKSVTITGMTLFGSQDMRPLYAGSLNTTVSFGELETIAKKIQARYAEKGFLTTTAYIPEQEISEGTIEIRVIEGKMGVLKIEGNRYFSSGLIEKFIHVKKNELLNINTLQRDLLRLMRNPDLELSAVLEAGSEVGTSDIVVRVKEKLPYHIGFGSDNQGTRLTGKYRGSVYLLSSNLTGRMDSLFVNSLFSSLSLGESMSYLIPIGTHGTLFGIDLVYFVQKIGKEYKSLDITGRTEICVPHFSWELYLSEDTQVYANAGIQIKSVTKRVSGARSADDQLRLPYFGFSVSRSDAWGGAGQTVFSPSCAFGTEGFMGASSDGHPSASRSGTGGSFFKYEQGLNRTQKMPFDSYSRVRTQFQAASTSLPSSEQLQLGGAYSVRGYPEGDYSADRGGYINLEWIFPLYLIPKSWSLSGSTVPLRHQIEPVIFFDAGVGSLKHTEPQEEKHKYLAGAGGGLRFNFPHAYLRLDWAKYVGDAPAAGNGPSTFYLTFQSEF